MDGLKLENRKIEDIIGLLIKMSLDLEKERN